MLLLSGSFLKVESQFFVELDNMNASYQDRLNAWRKLEEFMIATPGDVLDMVWDLHNKLDQRSQGDSETSVHARKFKELLPLFDSLAKYEFAFQLVADYESMFLDVLDSQQHVDIDIISNILQIEWERWEKLIRDYPSLMPEQSLVKMRKQLEKRQQSCAPYGVIYNGLVQKFLDRLTHFEQEMI